MIERCMDTGLLTNCVYTAIEREPPFHDTAFGRLTNWSESHKFEIEKVSTDRWILSNNKKRIVIEWVVGDVLDINEGVRNDLYDLLIGHAIIDLLPVPQCMPGLLRCVKPGGAFYFSLNFAGQTQFIPAHPHDQRILEAYHQDMDKRFPDLDWRPSETGQRLGPWLSAQGHTLLAEGPSDWKLPNQSLPLMTNSVFISNIIDTIENALKGNPGMNEWVGLRRHQLTTGELRYMATNRDCFGTTSTRSV